MDIAISGASGFIGSALRTSLESDGHRVIRLVRPDSATSAGDTIRWDPDAGTIDGAELDGLDAVVHLAGPGIGDRKWSPERKRQILESRTRGTGVIAAAVAACIRPPVLVTASAVGYYGDRGDAVLTEESEPGPDDNFLSEVCVAWEAAARPAADAGARVAWTRTGIVLDPDGGALAQMLRPFRLGLGGRQGNGRQYMSWIALPDQIAAIRRLIDDADLRGPVNLTAPNPVTNAEFAATLGKVLRRPTAIPTPMLPLRLRYGGELVQHLLLDSQRVMPAKLLGVGFEFAEPDLEGALRTVLADEPDSSDGDAT